MPTSTTSTCNGWFKSSHSNATGSCVETNFTNGAILVRDSKDREIGQTIVMPPPTWAALTYTLKYEIA
jgi:hypothetical protein